MTCLNENQKFFSDIVNKLKLRKCDECFRVFDMMDQTDAEEYFYGHDCET